MVALRPEPLVVARRLTKRFGAFTAVDGIEFEVRAGEAFGFLGPNGAGMTAASFSAMALCVTTFVRRIEQFDVVRGLAVMPMFLLSGTFFPVSRFPGPFEWVVQAVPLYHAVEMLRQLTTGAVHPSLAAHVAYLLLAGAAAFVVAMRRLELTLIK